MNQPSLATRVALAAVMALSTAAATDVLRWSNAAGGSAALASNWSPSQSPNVGDDLVFDVAGSSFPLLVPTSHASRKGAVSIPASSSHTLNGITVGNVSGDNPTMTMTWVSMTANQFSIVGKALSSTGVLTSSNPRPPSPSSCCYTNCGGSPVSPVV